MHFPGPGGHHPEIMRQVGKAGHKQRLEAAQRQQMIDEARAGGPQRRRRGLPVAGWFLAAVVISVVLGLIAQFT